MKACLGFKSTVCACIAVLVVASVLGAQATELGVNVNENIDLLDFDLLARSHTKWVRAFVDVFPFHMGEQDPRTDEQLGHFKQVSEAGYKMILSLKHNFHGKGLPLPQPGSDEESGYFQAVMEILDELTPYVDVLVVGNEPTWETDFPDRDFNPLWGDYPLAVFYKRLSDAILQHLEQHPELGSPPVYLGAFNRLELRSIQSMAAIQSLLRYANEDDRIAGIDIHIHGVNIEDFVGQLEFARRFTDKPILVTEFSLTYRHAKYNTEPLGANAAGTAFAQKYGLDPNLQVYQYVRRAAANPVPRGEWVDFLQSRSWFDPDLIQKAYRIFRQYNVQIATYAFSSGSKPGLTFGPDANPWILNQLFIPKLAYTETGEAATNYGLFDDFIAINPVIAHARATILQHELLIGLDEETYSVELPYGTALVPQVWVQELSPRTDLRLQGKRLGLRVQQAESLPGEAILETYDETGAIVHTARLQLLLADRPHVQISWGDAASTGRTSGTAFLRGVQALSIDSTTSDELSAMVDAALVPIADGELVTSAARTVYEGQTLPRQFLVDSRLFADGAYDLQVRMEMKNGDVFVEDYRVVCDNWDTIVDELEPAQESVWFGTMIRRQTILESEGWGSITSQEEPLFDDDSRLAPRGSEPQFLVWEAAALHGFALTLYMRDASTFGESLSVAVSSDMEVWQEVPCHVTELARSQSGWSKVLVSGELGEQTSMRYLRVVAQSGELPFGDMQIGRVEIASPKNLSSPIGSQI